MPKRKGKTAAMRQALRAVKRQAKAKACASPLGFARWDLVEGATPEEPRLALRKEEKRPKRKRDHMGKFK